MDSGGPVIRLATDNLPHNIKAVAITTLIICKAVFEFHGPNYE
jgi:hypothetical protein